MLCSHDNRFKMSGPSALTAPGPGSYEVAASITRGPPSGVKTFSSTVRVNCKRGGMKRSKVSELAHSSNVGDSVQGVEDLANAGE